MGRFYKTSKPEMIDFMFKVPEQAMLTAIKGMDAQLEGQESYLTDLQKQLKTAALEPDEEKRKARVAELEKKISEHSLKIWENPLAAIKEQKGIRDLGQEIFKDLTEGELYAYNANAAARKAYLDEQTKRATDKDGTIRVQDVDRAMAIYDLQYKNKQGAQFNKETGKFNVYGTDNIVNYFDNMKYATEIAGKMKTHKSEEWKMTKEGMNWFKITEGKEVLGLDEGTGAVYSVMMNNKLLTDRADYDIKMNALQKALNENRMKDIKVIEEEMRAEVYGLRDKVTGELILKPVLNADGTPQKEKVTIKDANGNEKIIEKPVMEPVQEGSLLREARAAADLYDVNDWKKGKDLQGVDQGDLANLESSNRMREAEHKKNLEAEVLIDVMNSSVSEGVLEGKTHEEVETNLANQKKLLDDKALNALGTIMNGIKHTFNSTTEYDKVKDALHAFLVQPSTPDWKGAHAYLTKLGKLGIIDPNDKDKKTVGSNFDKYQNDYIESNARYVNQKNYYDKLIADAEKNMPSELTTQGMNNLSSMISQDEKELKETEALISEYEKDPNKGRYSATYNVNAEKKKVADLKLRIKQLKEEQVIRKQRRNSTLDREVNFDASSALSKNKVNKELFFTGGNMFRAYGASPTEANQFGDVLAAIKKHPLQALVGNSTRSKQTVNGRLEDFNLNELIGKTLKGKAINSQQIDPATGNLIVITDNGEYKFAVEDVKLVRNDVQGVGTNPWTYTIAITDPTTSNRQYAQVYQPYEEVQSLGVTGMVDKYRADMAYENFISNAEAQLKNNQTGTYLDTNPQTRGKVKYIAGSKQVTIETSTGPKTGNFDSAEIKEAYKKVYNAK